MLSWPFPLSIFSPTLLPLRLKRGHPDRCGASAHLTFRNVRYFVHGRPPALSSSSRAAVLGTVWPAPKRKAAGPCGPAVVSPPGTRVALFGCCASERRALLAHVALGGIPHLGTGITMTG